MPVTGLRVLEESTKLRLPHFMTLGTRRPPLPPGFLETQSTPGIWTCRMLRKKSPVTRSGIDPGTFRLVAQRLNHYATPGPIEGWLQNKKPKIMSCHNLEHYLVICLKRLRRNTKTLQLRWLTSRQIFKNAHPDYKSEDFSFGKNLSV